MYLLLGLQMALGLVATFCLHLQDWDRVTCFQCLSDLPWSSGSTYLSLGAARGKHRRPLPLLFLVAPLE